MDPADLALEAAYRAETAKRQAAQAAREAALRGDPAAAIRLREHWWPVRLFLKGQPHDNFREKDSIVVNG